MATSWRDGWDKGRNGALEGSVPHSRSTHDAGPFGRLGMNSAKHLVQHVNETFRFVQEGKARDSACSRLDLATARALRASADIHCDFQLLTVAQDSERHLLPDACLADQVGDQIAELDDAVAVDGDDQVTSGAQFLAIAWAGAHHPALGG